MQPLVSVLLPVYNGGKYLREAVESILEQTFTDFQLVAVNDGSTDDSARVLEALAGQDARLKVISQSNAGIVAALNRGLDNATGEFVARMDADDVALPNRLHEQVDFLRSHPRVVAVGSWAEFIDADGDPVFTYRMPHKAAEIVQELLLGNGGALIHPAVMFRSQAVRNAGAYRSEYQYVEDLDLYLRLIKLGDLANIPTVLFRYRQHLQSINHTAHVRPRAKLAARLVNDARLARGLEPIDTQLLPSLSPVATHRQWSLWALAEGQRSVAWKHALYALSHEPLKRTSWSFVKMIASRSLMPTSPQEAP